MSTTTRTRSWWVCEWPVAAGGGSSTNRRTFHATEAEAQAAANRKAGVVCRHAVVYEIELEEA